MNRRLPLDGVRITDFTWIGAGAYTTKILADFGAEVIKIESATRPDSLRMGAPFKDGIKGINRSGYFADRNTGKQSIVLDMKHPRALGIVRQLVEKSDVIANNFTPGVMEKFGLPYDQVRQWKPDIIYLSMSMHGATGPEHSYLGYGASMVALTGLQHLTGLPERMPAGTGTNFPDHVPNPCHGVFATLAALRHRRRTGEGQYIDIAQTEPTVALLGPTMLDITVNQRVHQRNGNDHPVFAPHGVYPCVGTDRWIAIAVTGDTQWSALVEVMGSPAWMRDTRWSVAASRHAARGELDAHLAGETAKWRAEALMLALQARGVSAGVALDSEDVVKRDPQLAHRGHWVTLKHLEMGNAIYNAAPYRFTRMASDPLEPAPLLGQHTEQVLTGLLGMSREEFKALADSGALK